VSDKYIKFLSNLKIIKKIKRDEDCMQDESRGTSLVKHFLPFLLETMEEKNPKVTIRKQLMTTIFLDIIKNLEEWDKELDKGKIRTSEDVISALEVCNIIIEKTIENVKSEKLRIQMNGTLTNLRGMSKRAEYMEKTAISQSSISNSNNPPKTNDISSNYSGEKQKLWFRMIAEGDDQYRITNPPDFRYDVTQIGTGRNAQRPSPNYTKYGTLK
jgi:hypothetical protein